MAATLTTQAVFDAFLGEYDEFKTFFHGHSFTANQLGSAAALAILDLLQSSASVRARWRLEQTLREELRALWLYPRIGDLRQVGLVVGIELVADWRTRAPFPLKDRAGIRLLRGYGQARRVDPPHRQRRRPHAPLLHHSRPGPPNGPGPRRIPGHPQLAPQS